MSVVSTVFDNQTQTWAYAVWRGTKCQFSQGRFMTEHDAAVEGAAYAARQHLAPLFSNNRKFVSFQNDTGQRCAVIVTLPHASSLWKLTYTPFYHFPELPTIDKILQCALKAGLPCVPNFLGHLPMPKPNNSQPVAVDSANPLAK